MWGLRDGQHQRWRGSSQYPFRFTAGAEDVLKDESVSSIMYIWLPHPRVEAIHCEAGSFGGCFRAQRCLIV